MVYIRIGSIYLRNAYGAATPFMISQLQISKQKDVHVDFSLALIAKSMFLKACSTNPSSDSWLGAGRACFALKEYQEAEDALAEANVLNNRDGNVWAHLSLLSLTLGRLLEANQCIAQALRLGIKDVEIIKALGAAFLNENQNLAAAECFRLVLEENPADLETRELLVSAVTAGSTGYLLNEGAEIKPDNREDMAGVRGGLAI